MKLLAKISVGVGAMLLVSTNVMASTYTVKSGDTLLEIAYELGFSSIEDANIQVPSGDINKIFIGDVLSYKSKHKKRFVLRKTKVDLDKFCFKDNSSIHYRSSERCK
jgi:hypothetical protein